VFPVAVTQIFMLHPPLVLFSRDKFPRSLPSSMFETIDTLAACRGVFLN
jgi:hypothetical protein